MGNPADRTETTRLAPSPTGALHLGNARTFLVNWAIARRNGWRIVLRIDDLDGPRIKSWAAQQAIDDLNWLGLDWDDGPVYESTDLEPYIEAMHRLHAADATFECQLSRAEIEAAMSAPHADDHELRYDPIWRPTAPPPAFRPDSNANWRLKTTDRDICFDDGLHGLIRTNPWKEVGDFVIWTKRKAPSYQLAVVIDDARAGVTQIVRGDDLLPSTGRQILIRTLLGIGPEPCYSHLPLVVGPDGRRLAKRHGDTRISTYRDAGVRPERIVGLLGLWCGVTAERTELTADEFLGGLPPLQAATADVATFPRDRVTMTVEDHRWLGGDS
jgi:glutamyl-tRNA synthetase